tara:strand:+ start:349 stop:543 length:195 start_codon:yes stop_codon:yes gene_type:complete
MNEFRVYFGKKPQEEKKEEPKCNCTPGLDIYLGYYCHVYNTPKCAYYGTPRAIKLLERKRREEE